MGRITVIEGTLGKAYGVVGGYTGKGSKTVLPEQASAKFSFRLVGTQDPKAIMESFRAFVRERLPADAKVEFISHGASGALQLPFGSEALSRARRAPPSGDEEESRLLTELIASRRQAGRHDPRAPIAPHDDLVHARVDEVLTEMEQSLAIDPTEVIKASAKTGIGIDDLLCPSFGAVRDLAPRTFIDDLLVGALRARHVVVGDDFRFGANRQGTVNDLRAAGGRATP